MSFKTIKDDILAELQQGLSAGLQKCNLVTREEFEIQTEVLKKTRLKLEALEQKLASLEQRKSPLA